VFVMPVCAHKGSAGHGRWRFRVGEPRLVPAPEIKKVPGSAAKQPFAPSWGASARPTTTFDHTITRVRFHAL
jgi:hypothetical protein